MQLSKSCVGVEPTVGSNPTGSAKLFTLEPPECESEPGVSLCPASSPEGAHVAPCEAASGAFRPLVPTWASPVTAATGSAKTPLTSTTIVPSASRGFSAATSIAIVMKTDRKSVV